MKCLFPGQNKTTYPYFATLNIKYNLNMKSYPTVQMQGFFQCVYSPYTTFGINETIHKNSKDVFPFFFYKHEHSWINEIYLNS